MADEKLRKWVERKLEKGVDEERLKNSLENTGKDPSIVDDVIEEREDPFDEPEDSPGEEVFEEDTSTDNDSGEEGGEEESGFPGLSILGRMHERLDWRHSLVFLGIALIAGLGLMVQDSEVLEPEKQCVAVKMYSVTAEGGNTVADVRNYGNKSKVVLEVFEGGKKIGETSTVMEGRETITVDEVGSRASFHGIKCPEQSADRSY